VFTAASPPPTVAGHRAATSDHRSSQSEKTKSREERVESFFGKKREERERKGKMEDFFAYSQFI